MKFNLNRLDDGNIGEGLKTVFLIGLILCGLFTLFASFVLKMFVPWFRYNAYTDSGFVVITCPHRNDSIFNKSVTCWNIREWEQGKRPYGVLVNGT